MRTIPLFLSLFLFACAGTQKASTVSLPEEPHPEATVMDFEPVAKPATRPVLSVTDQSNLFRMSATDDEMVLKLRAVFDHVPGDESSASFEGSEGLVTIEVTARPSEEVTSPKIAVGTLRIAYGSPGWTVSPLRYDQNGTFATFGYTGERVDCDDEEPCVRTRSVQGFITVMRVHDQPEYTLTIRAEWHPKLTDHIVPQIIEMLDTARIDLR